MFQENSSAVEGYNNRVLAYVHVAITSAWLWDALISFSTEVETFDKRRQLVLVDVVYWLSRLLTLVLVVCQINTTTVVTTSASRCNRLIHTISATGAIATCLSTFLFLVRVKAVFGHSRRATYIFNTLWFIAVGGVIATVPFAFSGSNDEVTHTCVITRIDKNEIVGSITVAIFDSAVFISISYHVISLQTTARERWTSFFKGTDIGMISQVLLRTGQLYAFPMLILLICLMVIEFSSFIPAALSFQCHGAVYLASATFYNAMACRVFRLLRLLTIPTNSLPSDMNTEMSDLHFRGNSRAGEATSTAAVSDV
ncbi:hypothetical protein QCA50_011590 [Cerrena zonata]|uniref:DUF6533 domain-containing protein n=1 Tax=Cerrena zonata TaxID=2478898 RepID=A0AAW0G6C3_9APHY